ncbi:MAG TPA: hypothetical protein VF797_16880 [Noviherbaspirillum sp.]
MNRFLKTLLLWLVLLSLPFQGIAATMQTVCAPMAGNGSAGMPVSVAVHHHDDQAMTMAHADAGHHGAAVRHDSASGKSHDGKHKHATCSLCAHCCVAAPALLSGPDPDNACRNSLLVTAAPLPWLAGIVPSGLERPPKRLTA